ncbi:MAG: HAMP domain-containing protein [Bacteroidales bacterium]|nr:HAMP domain-containing protein [Bacteroidales bacterium]
MNGKGESKKLSFRELIRKEYLKAALIPILIIEVMLLVLYFGINHYKNLKTRDTLLSEAKINLQEISVREAQKIDQQLSRISALARILQKENQRFFEDPSKFPLPDTEPLLKVAYNGSMYKENNNGGSSIYYSNLIPFTAESYRKARLTEALDPLFKATYEADSNIVAVYINTWDNMNRYYPFIDKTYEQFEPQMNITVFNFYYEADAKHNPGRGVVWTDAYLDPAGQGWMASCLVPIYRGDFLEGVTGIDVTVERFIQNVLKLKLPWAGVPILVGRDKGILAMPPEAEKIFGLVELKSHDYNETIKQDTYKPDEYNFLKNPDIPQKFKEFVKSDQQLTEIELGGKTYLITRNPIAETGWEFYSFVDEDILFAPIYKLHHLGTVLGILALVFLILFYIPFFIALLKRSNVIASKIIAPLDYLIQATAEVAQKVKQVDLQPVGIMEIDTLSQNFNQMTEELKIMYDRLEEKVNEAVKQLRERDHMLIKQSRQAAMGEMIGNIAHQWRQPLNSIAVMIQNLEDAYHYGELNDTYLKEKIGRIMEIISFMSQTIDDFRYFFKPDKEKMEFNLSQNIEQTLNFVSSALMHNNISLVKELDPALSVEGYPSEFSQVILNIVNNAKESLIERQVEKPEIRIRLQSKDHHAQLIIADNGGGVEPAVMDKIFEPYFTTKEMGTGLGLYMSKTIIETNMKGRISVANDDRGAVFSIELPISQNS